jgi:hypothetical protein
MVILNHRNVKSSLGSISQVEEISLIFVSYFFILHSRGKNHNESTGGTNTGTIVPIQWEENSSGHLGCE